MSIDFIRSFTGPHILQQARDIFARKKNPTEFDAHLLFRPGLDSFWLTNTLSHKTHAEQQQRSRHLLLLPGLLLIHHLFAVVVVVVGFWFLV